MPYGRPTLMDGYMELREAGGTSDFPSLLGNIMGRKLIDWAQSVPQEWRRYVAITEASDFRPQTSVLGYEAEDLLPIGEEGAYQDSILADAYFTWVLGTYGRAFSINRNVIINDDLGYIKQQPRRWGRAAGRKIATFVPQTLLEGNGLAFDGEALFSSAHANEHTGGGAAFGSTALQTGITGMRKQTVLGVFHSTTPKFILIPPELEFAAKQLIASTLLIAAAGSAPATGEITTIGNKNVMEDIVDIVIDPFLTDTNAWYLFADPADTPALFVGFLNGKQTPDLLVEAPVMQNVAGGTDPYEFEFDVLRYKVRYDFGGAVGLPWGVHRFNPS